MESTHQLPQAFGVLAQERGGLSGLTRALDGLASDGTHLLDGLGNVATGGGLSIRSRCDRADPAGKALAVLSLKLVREALSTDWISVASL